MIYISKEKNKAPQGAFFIEIPAIKNSWNETDVLHLCVRPIIERISKIIAEYGEQFIYCDEPILVYYLTLMNERKKLNLKFLFNFYNKLFEVF